MKSGNLPPMRRLKHFQVGEIFIMLGKEYKVVEKSGKGISVRRESYSTAGKHTYKNYKGTILKYGPNCQLLVEPR